MLKSFILASLKFYKAALSPLTFAACKYYPTCSCYAVEAVEKYGVRRGLWMAIARVFRCRPFHPGGYDPVV
jgi:putative membrane protein insertion efficiency factor